jgi:hypothetical protein
MIPFGFSLESKTIVLGRLLKVFMMEEVGCGETVENVVLGNIQSASPWGCSRF